MIESKNILRWPVKYSMGRHFLLLFISFYISSPANKIKGKSSRRREWGRRHHTSSVSTCLLVWRKRGSTDVGGSQRSESGRGAEQFNCTCSTSLIPLPFYSEGKKNENTEKGNYLLSRQVLGNIYSMIFFLRNLIHDATCIYSFLDGDVCVLLTHTPKQICTTIRVLKLG